MLFLLVAITVLITITNPSGDLLLSAVQHSGRLCGIFRPPQFSDGSKRAIEW